MTCSAALVTLMNASPWTWTGSALALVESEAHLLSASLQCRRRRPIGSFPRSFEVTKEVAVHEFGICPSPPRVIAVSHLGATKIVEVEVVLEDCSPLVLLVKRQDVGSVNGSAIGNNTSGFEITS